MKWYFPAGVICTLGKYGGRLWFYALQKNMQGKATIVVADAILLIIIQREGVKYRMVKNDLQKA